MAYYVGRDVDVFFSTEHESCKIVEHTDFKLRVSDGAVSSATSGVIAYSLADIGETYTKFTDVTGVDVSTGAQDEDISYMGLRNQGKIEVKKDSSITVTMKKKDRKMLQLHQGKTDIDHAEDDIGGHPARWGLTELVSNGNFLIQGGDIDPKSCVDFDDSTVTTYGFRIILEFKGDSTGTASDGAALVLRNCTLSDVTHTTSNEAADEETVTFSSQVKPIVANARRASADTTAAFDVSLTTQTPLTEV